MLFLVMDCLSRCSGSVIPLPGTAEALLEGDLPVPPAATPPRHHPIEACWWSPIAEYCWDALGGSPPPPRGHPPPLFRYRETTRCQQPKIRLSSRGKGREGAFAPSRCKAGIRLT